MGGVIGCQISNFSNSCMASTLLKDSELSFKYITREILLQQMMKTMLISLYVRSINTATIDRPLVTDNWSVFLFSRLLESLSSILTALNGKANAAPVL